MSIWKSIGIFNPSEEELNKLGLSRFAYEDNWIHLAKLAGTFLFSRTFTVAYHSTRIIALFTMLGFIYGAFRDGDRDYAFEGIQYLLIVVILYGGCSAYGFYHDDFLDLLRLVGKGGFDYEGTLTRKAEEEIATRRDQNRLFKEIFKKIFRVILVVTSTSVCGKRPLGRLIHGRGPKLVDGEHDLIWSGAFGMYWPFADNWVSYILAITFNNVVAAWIVVGNVGCVSAFLFMAEDILCEFSIVSCTFRHCVERAKVLHAHRAFESLKTIMYVPLFILIVGWAMVTCVSVYLLLSNDVSLEFKLPLPVILFSEAFVAFLYCNYGQRFTDACEEIGSSLYEDSNWTEHGHVMKQYITIIKGFCDMPNGFSAGGFGDLDHITFSNLVSTAYSYIGFILST